MSNAQKLRELMDKELPREPNVSPGPGETLGPDYSSIELDEDEIEQALTKAREDKFYRLARLEYSRRITEEPERPAFTAEEVFDQFKTEFDVEPGSKYEKIVKHLCAYFTNDPRSSKDPQKGLLLCGGVGIGKTTLMEFFQRNQKASYRIVSCRHIESAYGSTDPEKGGDEAIRQYSSNFKVAMNASPFGHRYYGYCFDDLGVEAVGSHYGNKKDVMVEVLSIRYDGRLDHFMTHMTTNLSPDAVRHRYGERVFDRMREMFNIIDFPVDAKSRRK